MPPPLFIRRNMKLNRATIKTTGIRMLRRLYISSPAIFGCSLSKSLMPAFSSLLVSSLKSSISVVVFVCAATPVPCFRVMVSVSDFRTTLSTSPLSSIVINSLYFILLESPLPIFVIIFMQSSMTIIQIRSTKRDCLFWGLFLFGSWFLFWFWSISFLLLLSLLLYGLKLDKSIRRLWKRRHIYKTFVNFPVILCNLNKMIYFSRCYWNFLCLL